MAIDRTTVALIAVGLGAGTASGFFGIGGGAIMVPGMVIVAGLTQHQAHANSLGAVIPIAIFAVVPFALAAEVDPLLALILASGSLGGARVGARLMGRMSERQLRLAFSAVLAATAIQMLVSPASGLFHPTGAGYIVVGVAVGLVGGFASALLGIGGGMVLVPAMSVLMGVPQHLAQGTSLLTIIPTAFVGAQVHRRAGLISMRIVALLAVGGIVGGFVASNIALGIDEATLRRAFAIFALVMLARLLAEDPAWGAARTRLATALGRGGQPG
jgi:uncharacterized membrane protein YfcA